MIEKNKITSMLVALMVVMVVGLSFGGLVMTAAAGEPDPVYTSWRNNEAVGGYDVVSFYSGKPKRGIAEFTASYKGANWQFETQANMDLFLNNPEVFEPQYGGYCAWAAAHDKLARGNPKYWNIRDGQLYLNFNQRIQNKWLENIETLKPAADENWPVLIGSVSELEQAGITAKTVLAGVDADVTD